MKQNDQDIVKLVLQGDKDKFEVIVERYYDKLHRYAMRLLNFNSQDADDVVSSSLLKAYQNLAGYNPRLKFSSWIYRIVHNEAVSLIRKNSKFFSFDPFTSSISLIPGKKDVNISKLEVKQVLDKLPPNDKNLLVLFYLEELSIKEIAEILKTTSNSAKSRLSQARSKAKKLIKS